MSSDAAVLMCELFRLSLREGEDRGEGSEPRIRKAEPSP